MQIKSTGYRAKPKYSKKTHKLSWTKLKDGLVEVRLTNKLNGDIQYGKGKNIAEGIEAAIRAPAYRPEFKPSTILRRSSK